MDDNTKAAIGAIVGGLGTLSLGHGFYVTGSELQILLSAGFAIAGVIYAWYKRKPADAAAPK